MEANIEEPGMHTVLQNMAYNKKNPLQTIPEIKPKEKAGFTLDFSPEAAEKFTSLAHEAGFANIAEYVNAAVSIYGQMLLATNDGFSDPIQVHTETKELLRIQLTPDVEETD